MWLASFDCLVRSAFFTQFETGAVGLVRDLMAMMPDDILQTVPLSGRRMLCWLSGCENPCDDNEPLVHCVENVPDELLTLSNLRLLILRLIAQESKYAL